MLVYKYTELLHVVQERAEGPKAPSPGHRPGYVVCKPVALKGQKLSITRQKLYNITQPT